MSSTLRGWGESVILGAPLIPSSHVPHLIHQQIMAPLPEQNSQNQTTSHHSTADTQSLISSHLGYSISLLLGLPASTLVSYSLFPTGHPG